MRKCHLRPLKRANIFQCLLFHLLVVCSVLWVDTSPSAVASRRVVQEPTSTARNEDPPQALIPGVLVERTLAGGETKTFLIELDSNQFAQAIVEQKGIDLVLTVLGPEGSRRAQVDRPNGTYGPEIISWVADRKGVYQLKVQSFESKASPGGFSAMLETPRPPEPRDLRRILAESLSAESYLVKVIVRVHGGEKYP